MEARQHARINYAPLPSEQSEKTAEGWGDTTPTSGASPPAGQDEHSDPLSAAEGAENKANEALEKVARLDNRIEHQTMSAEEQQTEEAAKRGHINRIWFP